MSRLINFTKGEALALLHRLEADGCIADALEDEGTARDTVEDRCNEFARDLKTREPFVCVHPEGEPLRELDLAILTDAVEGSTWVAAHDPRDDTRNTPQGKTAAGATLKRAALKICKAFGQPPFYIDVPRG